MTINKNKVVNFHYRINDLQGNVLESSFAQDPAAYLHGHNNMMIGIENALEGKTKGDEFTVELPAKDTFGEIKSGAQQRISVKHLQGEKNKKWKPGMTAVVHTDKGAMEVTIVKVGKFMVTVDTNHPLAGQTLSFTLQIVDVRDATQEEIAHGHAHGVGGHQH